MPRTIREGVFTLHPGRMARETSGSSGNTIVNWGRSAISAMCGSSTGRIGPGFRGPTCPTRAESGTQAFPIREYSQRKGASAFTQDSSGRLWLFGGTGVLGTGNTSGNKGNLSDLWRFDGANWTWLSGPIQLDQGSTYGTQGVAAASNVPGARSGAAAWTDNSGNFWLFGGSDPSQAWNDLWKFDGTNWTWISGANTSNASGVYGSPGVASASNTPGARWGSCYWKDSTGKLWLFGGNGRDSAGVLGNLDDLWRFDGSNWIWMSVRTSANPPADYGTQGVAAATNTPGGRWVSSSWVDALATSGYSAGATRAICGHSTA